MDFRQKKICAWIPQKYYCIVKWMAGAIVQTLEGGPSSQQKTKQIIICNIYDERDISQFVIKKNMATELSN